MPLPLFQPNGLLEPGIHAASLSEIISRFGIGNAVREQRGQLLRMIVERAATYTTMKRVLVWGSFVSSKTEPNDLDYSVVVSVGHSRTDILAEDRRFFRPVEARMRYGVDRSFLFVLDYPLEYYVERLDFMCHDVDGQPRGIVEISLRGEKLEIAGDQE
jgi:hypothetical protein